MLKSLYAVLYGKGFHYSGPDFVFIYYLANIDGKWVYIDVGFSSKNLAENMGIQLLTVPEEVKEAVKPDKVDAILITHSHWDHIDDTCKYCNAKIYLSELTYKKAIEENCDNTKNYLKKARKEGRVIFIEPGEKVLNCFTYEFVGGHSSDSGVFYFDHDNRKYCLAGDECFSIQHLRDNIPIDNAFNPENNSLFTKKCFENEITVLPSHDGAVLESFTKISYGITRII